MVRQEKLFIYCVYWPSYSVLGYLLTEVAMYVATDSSIATIYLFSGDTHKSPCKIPQGSNVCLTMHFSMILNVCDMRGICVSHAHCV